MKKIILILFFLVLLPAGTSGSVWADDLPASSPDEALLALINAARQNPLAVAAAYGMDPEKILSDLPQLEKILKEGLPPLTSNAVLAGAACAHTGDMFAQGYYSHLSPDGRSYDERIRQAGYPAVVSGESLGLILFANFINPDDAVRLIFQYMLQDELDPARTQKRNILDPCLKEAGISIQAGALDLGGAQWNVYLATCDFGAVLSCPEARLLDLINQARQNPLQVAAALGIDPEQVLADFPEWHDLLTQGLPPLTFNASLAQAARAHAADMLANGYYSHDSLDGRTADDRIRGAGYIPVNEGESLWLACLGGDDFLPDSEQSLILLQQIFANIFAWELKPGRPEPKNILDASFRDVGIGIAGGTSPGLGGICGDHLLLLVLDFGTPPEAPAQSPPDAAK
jgi:hypothetical protein